MATLARLGRLMPNTSALFVCDIQEKFRPVISVFPAVVDASKRMVRGCQILGVPVVVTEQYPKALGNTVSEIKEVLDPKSELVSKTCFSMCSAEIRDWLGTRPTVKQVLLCGIEAHVCVFQTTLDLLESGYEVHLLVDAISSQRPHDRAIALQRMAQMGAHLSSSEMALFALMKDAKNQHFKEISNLVKEQRPEPLPITSML